MVAFVDDEVDLVVMAEEYLTRDGFQIRAASDVRSAARLLREHPVDLLVLDLGLPDGNGLDFLRSVQTGRHLPVIILTGWGAERERIVGLELGADDYVVKPFSLPELAARIRAVLRRAQGPVPETVICHGALVVDTRSHVVTVNGVPIPLTPLEYRLLAYLAAAPQQVFSPSQLLTAVWGAEYGRKDNASVAEHVYRLRRKLTAAGAAGSPRIVTVRGGGYRLDP